MRSINHIVLHCTGTRQDASVGAIVRYWKEELGWKNPGYHFIIDQDGKITNLLTIDKVANGVKGHNSDSIHISYIGGLNRSGKSTDTRTPAQYTAMAGLVVAFRSVYPRAKVLGHRDFAGVKKECPSFDASKFLKEIK